MAKSTVNVRKDNIQGKLALSSDDRLKESILHSGQLIADKEAGQYVRRTELGLFAMGYTGVRAVARDLMSSDDTIIDTEVIVEHLTGAGEVSHTTESHMDGFKTAYDGEPMIYISELGDLPLVKGLVAIVGGHGSGKTPFLRDTLYPALPESQAEYITFGEPWYNYGTRGSRAAERIMTRMIVGNKVVLIDSLKNVMDRTSGPLAKEGINRPFFTMLSDWSAVAMRMNCTIVVVVNLLSDTPAVLAENLNRLNSSTNMVILAEGNGSFSYKIRDHEGAKRITGTFHSDENRFSHAGSKTGPKAFSDSEYATRLRIVQSAILEQQLLQTI